MELQQKIQLKTYFYVQFNSKSFESKISFDSIYSFEKKVRRNGKNINRIISFAMTKFNFDTKSHAAKGRLECILERNTVKVFPQPQNYMVKFHQIKSPQIVSNISVIYG